MGKAIVWLDVEANGLTPEVDTLLEIGAIVTDFHGEPISDAYSSLVTVPDLKAVISSANPLVQRMHTTSNLWQDLWEKESKPAELIDQELYTMLTELPPRTLLFLGGNSVGTDRSFAKMHLPLFSSLLTHMTVDATGLATVLQETRGAPRYNKRQDHRALLDVEDSIEEYRHYLRFLAGE